MIRSAGGEHFVEPFFPEIVAGSRALENEGVPFLTVLEGRYEVVGFQSMSFGKFVHLGQHCNIDAIEHGASLRTVSFGYGLGLIADPNMGVLHRHLNVCIRIDERNLAWLIQIAARLLLYY